ncbi:hypothetical protein BGZ70_000313 [Mortierella alpina]|uniref:C2H2-type domain-containing protein n=1 Tax=Mortierella alpina TaxID=64518 RepID=A0A9P6IYG7_MORAP|nr:hypothetical protein BGZ70_000313 [Mortierella alpina]
MNPTFDIIPTLEMFNDLGPNPYIATAIPELNKKSNTSSSSSLDSLDTSKDNHSTASVLNHNNTYNNNNSNISSNNDNDNSINYWDFFDADQDFSAINLVLTPELSPSLSILSPDAHLINSPYGFDSLYSPSPSMGWASPLEQQLGGLQSPESFVFDFDFDRDPQSDRAMADFQLFPDCSAESAAVERLLMSPVLSQAELLAMAPVPETETIFLLGQDVQAPGSNVAPRKPVQSPTKPKFDPYKKQRRRRITTEDEHRVEIDGVVRYKCDQCGGLFSRPFNLKSHRFTHEGLKPHVCDHVDSHGATCGSAFARRHDLERHTRSRHSKIKKGNCKSCGVQFARSDAHKRHVLNNPACQDAAMDEQDDEQVSHL